MKKILLLSCFILAFSISSLSAFNFNFSIADTAGGNSETMSGGELFGIYWNKAEQQHKPYWSIADRLQLDFESKIITARARLDLSYSGNPDIENGADFKGFAQFTPIKQIGIAGGNAFFNTFAVKSSELLALDDTPTYGKLLKSGVALCSTIPFGDSGIKLDFAGGFEFEANFKNPDEMMIGGGIELSKKKNFSIGVTARNITAGPFGKYAVTAGIYPGKFSLNAGFIYNNTYGEYLPRETKYSLVISTGYRQKKQALDICADFMTGLTDEYIANGTKTTKHYDNFIPCMMSFRLNKGFTDNFSLGLKVKYTNLIRTQNNSTLLLYPNAEFNFLNDSLSLHTGLKFDFNFALGGITEFSIPFSLKYKFTYKHK